MKYYFAYGSNMNEDQMKERCPESEFIGIGYLPEHKIGFTRFSQKRNSGVADILVSPGHEVWGLIYKVTDKDLISLDKCEGHPNDYRRNTLDVIMLEPPEMDFSNLRGTNPDVALDIIGQRLNVRDETKISAEVYEVVVKESNIKPSEEYLEIILQAAFENGFPDYYQKELAAWDQPVADKKDHEVLEIFSKLYSLFSGNEFPHEFKLEKGWAGAELVITHDPKYRDQLLANHPYDLVVFTPFWKELSYLVNIIFQNKNFNRRVDGVNKYDILKEIGEAALQYQKENPNDNTPNGICMSVLYKMYELLS